MISLRRPGQGVRVMWPMPPTSQDPSSGPSNMVTPGRAPWHSQRILHELTSGRLNQGGKKMENIVNGNGTCLRKSTRAWDEGKDKVLSLEALKGHAS